MYLAIGTQRLSQPDFMMLIRTTPSRSVFSNSFSFFLGRLTKSLQIPPGLSEGNGTFNILILYHWWPLQKFVLCHILPEKRHIWEPVKCDAFLVNCDAYPLKCDAFMVKYVTPSGKPLALRILNYLQLSHHKKRVKKLKTPLKSVNLT